MSDPNDPRLHSPVWDDDEFGPPDPLRHANGSATAADVAKSPIRITPAPEVTNGRLRVEYRPGDYGPQVRAVLEELNRRLSTYVNGMRLVHVVRASDKEQARSEWTDSAGRKRFGVHAGAPQIMPIRRSSLKLEISDSCAFHKFAMQGKQWVPCPPPDDIVGAIFEGPWPSMARLVTLAETPILRPDGTILQRPGYDEQTAYWYEPRGVFPAVPERPTEQDAQAAYAELAEVFCDFPYVDEGMRAIPIANALTVLSRAYLVSEAAPGFVYDASAGGTGKTLQTDVVSVMTTGRPASRKAFPASDEECEKMLAAYALRGSVLISIDDIKRPLGGENLDRVITARDEVDFRKLGETLLITSPWRAVLMFTGVNVNFFGQMARRVLVARVESPYERPQDRADFTHPNLVEWVTEHRPRLVAALITMLRAYIVAGCPDMGGIQWGSFEGWSRFVPHVIKFAGGPDVIKYRAPEDADVERETISALLAGIHALLVDRAPHMGRHPDDGMTAGELSEELFARNWIADNDPTGAIRGAAGTLRDLTKTRPTGAPSPQQIARQLGKYKGRPVRVGTELLTLRYEVIGHDHTKLWRVKCDHLRPVATT